MNLALDALPDFTCLPGAGRAPARRDLDLAERRLHGARLRRGEVRTVLAAAVHRHRDSELTDPSVAPPGKHVMSCFVQYAPYHLSEGTWDEQREAFGDTVVNTIAEYAPNIKDIILHRQVSRRSTSSASSD